MATRPTPLPEQGNNSTKTIVLAGAAPVLLVGIIYWPVLRWLAQQWIENPMYSHGFLIPLISAWLLWSRRPHLREAEKSVGRGGLLLVIVTLVIQCVCAAVDVKTVGAYSLIFLLWAIIYCLWGHAVARIALFPVGFLFFMVPLYDALTDTISLHLKLLVTRLAVWLMDKTQILAAVREGVMIHLPSGSLEVADPCSGIRSLVALLAMAVLLGYLYEGKLWERSSMVLAAVPVAIVANLLRVIILCLTTEVWGTDISEDQFIHTLTGILVYIVALGGLMVLGRLLPTGWRRPGAV